MRQLNRALLLLSGAGLTFLAFILATPSVGFAATPADTIVMAKQIDDMITIDPAEAYEFSALEIDANLYDRIMTYDPATSKVVPGVIASSEASKDGSSLTLKVRPGQKFTSGNPLTADDIAFSLQRVVKLDKSPAFILTQFGWTKDNVEEMVVAKDPETVSLTIPAKLAPSFVLNCLSAGVGSVLDKKEVLSRQKDGDLGYEWLKSHAAGSGAFSLRSWKPNEVILLDANPNYAGGSPKVKRVAIRHVPEPATQRLLLEKGDVDIARNMSPDQIEGLKSNAKIKVESFPKADTWYVALNQKDERLSKPGVRQALRWLIDYQNIADSITKGRFKVHQAFLPEGFPGALNDSPYKLDVEKAKKLLADAGYPDGFELQLDVSNSYPSTNVAQAIQATMGQAGIKISIVPGEQRQVITKYRARQHQAVLLYWSPDYMDPHSNAGSFAWNPDNSDNASDKPLAWRNAWDIPDLTKRTEEALKETDETARMAMYAELQKSLLDDGPFLIAFQNVDQVAMRKEVGGFVDGALSDHVLYKNLTKN
ncbi:peptide/nickel transport system substrate-binding protein [Arboricoccus pini]|uniref:Peptide/nickel transport system substrate-binding protein n=1 Tax=Arboricoccus pini TaxID=1963835 RepID=A0A212R8A4_9PROT|nr:ABC transporter substrate-binding protein [Arboricoccus pini]SNB68328.1 peptide/nickel transport system substrate-binding protein [Arboricoccus pini]